MNSFTEFTNFILVALFFIAASLILVVLWLGIRLESLKREIKKFRTRLSFAGLEKDKIKAGYDQIKADYDNISMNLMTQSSDYYKMQSDYDKLSVDYDLAKSTLSEEEKLSEFLGGLHAKLLLKWWNLREETKKLRAEIKLIDAKNKLLDAEIKSADDENKLLKSYNSDLLAKSRKRNDKGQFVKSSPEPTPDRDWTTASKDELLAEAKRRYPVGTKIDCLHGTAFNLIETDIFEYDDKFTPCIRCRNKENYVSCVFDGKWAEILPA